MPCGLEAGGPAPREILSYGLIISPYLSGSRPAIIEPELVVLLSDGQPRHQAAAIGLRAAEDLRRPRLANRALSALAPNHHFPQRLAATRSFDHRARHGMRGGPSVFSASAGIYVTSYRPSATCDRCLYAYNRLSVACCLAARLGGGRPALLAARRGGAAPVARGLGVWSAALPPGTISGVLGVC